jgi:hypothetical protein
MRALVLMLVAIVGISCDTLVRPDPECTSADECNMQSTLCVNSCGHPNALKICYECCKQEFNKCMSCLPWNVKHCW